MVALMSGKGKAVAEKTGMPVKTRKALEASIAHWKRHATGKARREEDAGPFDCALCSLFNNECSLNDCSGCPVWAKTGSRYCARTPYARAWRLFNLSLPSSQQSPAFRRAAARELAFLRSLHPDKKVRDLKAKDVKP